jgi:LuxR family maltose regulon positive regulatory protein
VRQLRTPRSQRAIADELSVSINTVKTHTSSIYRKLDVSSRDDAVTRAIERGLI